MAILCIYRGEEKVPDEVKKMSDEKNVCVVDVTEAVGNALDKAGFGSDSNHESDITKAGVWDLCDAVSGKDNSKFSKEDAVVEMYNRGL